MSGLQFYDTLRRRKVPFEPLSPSGPVRLYTCGPTVYDDAHLGNFRAYVFEDLLRRVLEAKGYQVSHVMNVTDVDDKTIAGARRENCDLMAFTRRYEEAFFKDLDLLRVKRPTQTPRATENIGEMQALVRKLVDKGLAYERDGSVYYRIQGFPAYGKLSGRDLEKNMPGQRVDQDEYDKEQVADFALWKRAKEGEPAWDSPWGKGRPGWHIECSAMSMKHLASETIDIHAGGEDLIFPHHENEIAQSEGATGKPFVRFWLHCKFLVVEGEKMSKSKGNFYTLRDLLARGADPRAVRYLLLSTHYRVPLNFTVQGLAAAEQACRSLEEFWSRTRHADVAVIGDEALLAECKAAREKFWAALGDDLNVADALGRLFSFVGRVHETLDARRERAPREFVTSAERCAVQAVLEDANRILAVLDLADVQVPAEILRKSEERQRERERRNYERADQIRKEIEQAGFIVQDSGSAVIIKLKGNP